MPILIVGGGVVGLCVSLCLSQHGIDCLVVERRAGTSIHPRARSVNSRTMELFRHLGIDGRIREAGASSSHSFGIYSGISLREVIGAKKLKNDGPRTLPGAGLFETISPVNGTFVTQDLIEPVLVEVAKERGVEVRFNTECLGIQQDNDRVTATLRDRQTDSTMDYQADYLIAADGAKSQIRASLNIPTTGCGGIGHLLNILFHADLKSLVHNREFSLCVIERPEVYGLFTSINNSDRWVFHLSYDPSKGETAADFTPARCKELLQIAIGIPNIEIEIESILAWEPSVQIAEHTKQGRVFLAGDSAHQMLPWGGQGANSGIADACNLAWKMAAVLKGQAGKSLLDTYEIERIPVGREAAESSALGADERGIISTKNLLTVIKGWIRPIPLISGHGYGYTSRAICVEDTSPLGGLTWKPWTLPSLFLSIDGRPGRRAPHVWLMHEEEKISTLDLLGKSFVLLAGADGSFWLDAARGVSSSLKVPIAAYCILGPGGEGEYSTRQTGEFESAAGISSRGAILVRPDDFVVFRERKDPVGPRNILEKAMRTALCLD
jgi:putative polyketide hydroxylase